jgi:hypothetical protein
MGKKRLKQINLDLHTSYRTQIGTMNHKNPKSVFLTITSWGSPVKEGDYSKVINKVRDKVKVLVNEKSLEYFTENNIVDLDMRESGIREGKNSYMCCDITLYQKDVTDIATKEFQDKVKPLYTDILKIIDENQYFTFQKTKKGE